MEGLVNYSDSSDSDDYILATTATENKNDRNVNQKVSDSDSESKQEDRTDAVNNNYTKAEDGHPRVKRGKLDTEESLSEPKLKIRKRSDENVMKPSLVLPQSIQSMFSGGRDRQWRDDPSQHGNRTRSFPHVEGNWATHVFIPVNRDDRLVQFVSSLLHLFKPLQFTMMDDFHVSLSRSVVVRHHWIDSLVNSLRQALTIKHSCIGDLDDIKFYTNDEKTRTFMCVEISKEDTLFSEYVSAVDTCFEGFKLPKYYKNPSFHISIAWCVGDVTGSVSNEKINKAKDMLTSFCLSSPEVSIVFAQNICCRSGNKSFFIPLIV